MKAVKWIDGGVTAPLGFKASGMHVGVKTNNPEKKDLALIVSDEWCTGAAVYTKNIVQAAPLLVTRNHLSGGFVRAIIVNSGNANACAPNGDEHAAAMCRHAANALGIHALDVLVASTGVIGQELPIAKITDGIPELVSRLSYDGSDDAADAIMTTDTVRKSCAVEVEIGGKTVKIGGIAKGSGMIHPNMGTLLCFITTDCAISRDMLQAALEYAVNMSFNRISVDGDTSTNDMVLILANGLAGNDEIDAEGFLEFREALRALCVDLARKMAADGEGATHLITCTVVRAQDEPKAETIAKSVISSTLFKAAIFGADANWGRVLCAMGYSGAEFDPEKVEVMFASAAGALTVCKNGRGVPFNEEFAKDILGEHEVQVWISLGEGDAEATCWGCDITYDYIKINGDYRT